jgi:hypothetical protein
MSLPNGVNLIGISGNAGAGKDTLALYLTTFYQNVWREAFADPLKECASHAFGIHLDAFYDSKQKEEPNEVWGVSPRTIAQFLGTEIFRDTIFQILKPSILKGFWIRRLEGKLLGTLHLDEDGSYDENDTIVIPDVRFQDEYNWICDNGGIIFHLYRPGHSGNVGIDEHASERGFEFTHPEVTHEIVNDDSIEQLFVQAKKHLPAHLITK